MANQGGTVDSRGNFIQSVRVVTDTDATSGIGNAADPLRTDPTGTTVQPVSFSGGVTISSGTVVATQPTGTNLHVVVDAAPTTAVTGTFFQATQPISLAAAPTTPVTGTFFQATQPVSGTVTANIAAAQTVGLVAGTAVIGHVINDASAAVIGHVIADTGSTTAVTGNVTVVQPTGTNLHVVVDTAPSTAVTNAGTFAVQAAATLAAETTKVIGTVNVAATQTIAVTQATAANLTATVTPIAITKGTQGATGFTVQDLKDSGRVLCTFSASAVAGVTAEALITLTPYRDLVAGSTGTTFAVTAAKRLRLQSLSVTWRNNTAAAGGVTIRFRTLAGTVLVSSPVQASLNASTALATIGSGLTVVHEFPDGLELSGTMQFGLTQLAVGAVVGFDVHVIGYEY